MLHQRAYFVPENANVMRGFVRCFLGCCKRFKLLVIPSMSSGITTVSPSSSCLLFKSARAAMSSRKGSGNTRTRKPAHQNSFAFRHNPKSQKTAKILGMPNTGLCASCHDKVEWRKKYRKYRPLRQPATCNHCHKKAITAAYHKICTPCARERRVCPWCCTKGRPRPIDGEEGHEGEGGEGEEEAEEGGEGGAMEALADGVDMEDALEEERGGCREDGSGGGREEGTEAAEGKGRVDFTDGADE